MAPGETRVVDDRFPVVEGYLASSGNVAADIAVTPAGDITATDVQAALEELDTAISGAGGSGATVTDCIVYAITLGS